MKTVEVRIHCSMCGKFRTEHKIDINEFGYFSVPEAYCPQCFALLIVVIDGGEE